VLLPVSTARSAVCPFLPINGFADDGMHNAAAADVVK
jgi:hypothetical protein